MSIIPAPLHAGPNGELPPFPHTHSMDAMMRAQSAPLHRALTLVLKEPKPTTVLLYKHSEFSSHNSKWPQNYPETLVTSLSDVPLSSGQAPPLPSPFLEGISELSPLPPFL